MILEKATLTLRSRGRQLSIVVEPTGTPDLAPIREEATADERVEVLREALRAQGRLFPAESSPARKELNKNISSAVVDAIVLKQRARLDSIERLLDVMTVMAPGEDVLIELRDEQRTVLLQHLPSSAGEGWSIGTGLGRYVGVAAETVIAALSQFEVVGVTNVLPPHVKREDLQDPTKFISPAAPAQEKSETI